MDSHSQKINSFTQLWSLIGPLLVACTLFIVVLRSAAVPWELPLVALGGLILCYKWKWKGVVCSITILAGISMHVHLKNPTDWIWTATLALSIAAAYIVTALTLEEFHYAWERIANELEGQQKTLTQLNDQTLTLQNKYHTERQELLIKLDQSQQEISSKDEKLKQTERLISIVRDELSERYEQHEKLANELYEAYQKIAKIENEAKAYDEKVVIALSEKLQNREDEFKELQNRYDATLMEQRLARQQLEANENELITLRNLQQEDENKFIRNQTDQQRQQAIIHELNSHVELLGMEKQLLESSLTRLQSDYEQLDAQKHQQANIAESHHAVLQSLKEVVQKQEEEILLEKAALAKFSEEALIREKFLSEQIEESVKNQLLLNQKLAESQFKEKEYFDLKTQYSNLYAQAKNNSDEQEILNNKCEALRSELKAAELENKNALQREILQKAKIEELTVEIDQTKEKVIALASHENQLQAECRQLQEQLAIAQGNYQQALLNEELIGNQYRQLVNEIELQAQYITDLQAQHTQATEALKNAQERLLAQEASLVSSDDAMTTDMVERKEFRRMEGLYHQLRTQFMQKSVTLDETRRELFNAQEELAALNRAQVEVDLQGNDVEKALTSMILATERERESIEKASQKEIAHLHDLISVLCAKSMSQSK